MIGFLTGRLHSKQPPQILLDVQGVGYEIEAPMSTFYHLPALETQVTLLTHMHVREDAMLLFGFATEEERSLFKTLIKVNGVGAKMALGILSAMSVMEFVDLVEQNDIVGLTKIPGVGKKTAERLIIEMRDRLKKMGFVGSDEGSATSTNKNLPLMFSQIQDSAIAALESLGYKTVQAEKMVKANKDETLSLEALIKHALQNVRL